MVGVPATGMMVAVAVAGWLAEPAALTAAQVSTSEPEVPAEKVT